MGRTGRTSEKQQMPHLDRFDVPEKIECQNCRERDQKKTNRDQKKTNKDQKKQIGIKKKTKCRKHEKTQGNNEEIQEQWRDQKKTKSQKGEKGEKGEQKERKKERN